MTRSRDRAVVIGGGPAGLSTAIRLARSGVRVTVCEAKTYPHDKMCGEFLSPECAGLLDEIGAADAVAALQPVAIHTARITAPGGGEWQSSLPGTALGLSRRSLDAALASVAREAGVQVLERTRVEGVAGNLKDGFVVHATQSSQPVLLNAAVVVGAYGKRSVLDRALNRRFFHRQHPYLAVKAHFDGPPVPGRIELHGFPGGYCGLSEIEGGELVACLLVHEGVFRSNGGAAGGVDAFIAWMQTQNEHLQSWFPQAQRTSPHWITISQVCFESKAAVEQDMLMTGDAAGLITPLAGNGISMALEGGRLAAQAVFAYLQDEITASAYRRQYAARWARAFRGRLALGRMLQPLMLRPAALRLAVKLLRRVPPVGRYLVTHTRGVSSTFGNMGEIERSRI